MEAEDLDEYAEKFQKFFEELETKIGLIGVAQDQEKEPLIRQCENVINEIGQELITYTAEIEIVDYSAAKEHREMLKVHEARLNNLESQFNTAKMKARNIGDELANLQNIGDEELQNRALQMGDKLFEKSKKRAGNILNMIKDSNELVGAINDEIKEQNQRMLAMEDLIKDSQSHLKRASALVDYFSDAFAKDICMRVMIVLIAIAIFAVIIMSVMGKSSKKTTTTTNTAAQVAKVGTGRVLNCEDANTAYTTYANTSVSGVRSC